MNIDDPRLSGVPGIDLTYAQLTDRSLPQSVRNAWHEIGDVAEAFGIDALRANGPSARSKTISEFAAEILPLLPEGMDLLPLMEATAGLVRREHETTYEVRRLRTAEEALFDVPVWVLCSEWADETAAERARSVLAEAGFFPRVFMVERTSNRALHH